MACNKIATVGVTRSTKYLPVDVLNADAFKPFRAVSLKVAAQQVPAITLTKDTAQTVPALPAQKDSN
jgi:hypothetical protein